MPKLFNDTVGNPITSEDIYVALKESGAADCDILFIHSDIMFGSLGRNIKRRQLLQEIHEQICKLNVKYTIIPTFTYSFPNHEDYDVAKSKTSMGAYNEFVRQQDGRFRTDDPLLSVSVPSTLEKMFDHVSNHSLGEGSALDILHHLGGVKFLFLGAEMGECFTYVHYVEKMMNVPYRFDLSFEGNVIYPNGEIVRRKQTIHTQCFGVTLPAKYDYFEDEMEEKGHLRKIRVGNRFISSIAEKDAYSEIKTHIEKNVSYFLEKPFVSSKLIHKYTYSTENGRITHC